MAVVVNLEKGKLRKKGFIGFSWTTFCFNFFVPLFRGDLKWAGILFGGEFAVFFSLGLFFANEVSEDTLGFVAMIALLAYRIAMGFIYNKHYTEKLLGEGFEPVGDSDRTALKFSGLYSE